MMEVTDPAIWSQALFGEAALGDQRRTKRLVAVGATLARHTGASVPDACRDNPALQEGTYRFTRNDAVDPDEIARAGFEATAKMLGSNTILAIEDSTVLSYEHSVVDELGDIGCGLEKTSRGIWVHSVLMVEAETRRTLGLVGQQRWIRDESEYGKRKRKGRPIEEKESVKWQKSAEHLRELLGSPAMARVVAVADREADVYAYMAYKQGHQERFVIRAAWNRKVMDEDHPYLFDALNAAPVRGKVEVSIPQRGGRRARTATLVLRATRVVLRRPKNLQTNHPGQIEANAVLAREENPRGNDPLEWILLTGEPIASAADVERLLEWYRQRWKIEVFHKAWKSGAGVERLRMQTGDSLERMAVILAFVAVRLMQLRETFERDGDAPCGQILEGEEWQLLWITLERTKPPKRPPSTTWAYQALGRLGGWGDSKRTGIVGWEALWRGWWILQDRVEAVRAFQEVRKL